MKDTLGEILCTEQRRERRVNWRAIPLDKKRYLTMKITEALVHLYGSPLSWDVDSIYGTEIKIESSLGSSVHRATPDQDQLKVQYLFWSLPLKLLELILEESVHVCDKELEEGIKRATTLYVFDLVSGIYRHNTL
jgi:hypothetical protein